MRVITTRVFIASTAEVHVHDIEHVLSHPHHREFRGAKVRAERHGPVGALRTFGRVRRQSREKVAAKLADGARFELFRIEPGLWAIEFKEI